MFYENMELYYIIYLKWLIFDVYVEFNYYLVG